MDDIRFEVSPTLSPGASASAVAAGHGSQQAAEDAAESAMPLPASAPSAAPGDPDLDDARADLDLVLAERSQIRSAIRRLNRQGSVAASVIEKLERQLDALDRWADHYTRLIGD